MGYVDGFVIPIPKKNVRAYTAMAKKACAIWMEHGCLEYRETVGDDLDIDPNMTSFNKLAGTRSGETVIFAWALYKSKAHRDQCNKKIMADPRLGEMMKNKKNPFDMKRMAMGGFKVIVEN
jgi:uncharacterized protein YbaA (DUF1428 family)